MPDGQALSPAPLTPTETFHVDSRVVACDGGDAPLGHPRVWLRIVGEDVTCPYCSRRYVLNADASDTGHH